MATGTLTGFTINGKAAIEQSGASVSGAGDVNADGIDDLIVGAVGARPAGEYSGASYVVFGQSGWLDPTLELSALDGTNGFAVDGKTYIDQTGCSVSDAGDINADGIDDLLIGARTASADTIRSGKTYLVFGRSDGFDAMLDLSDLNGANGVTINGKGTDDRSGSSVSGVGDVNADGIDDLIIGATDAAATGESYVVFGRPGGFNATLDLSDLDGANGFALGGKGILDFAGYAVSGVGDINEDGIDDLVIGARGADANGINSGETYVVFGRSDGFAARLDLSALDGANGFAIVGKATSDWSGASVSGAGDVNADGIDDLVIGAPVADPNGDASGESYVVFGRSDGFAATLELSTLNGANGFTINGKKKGDYNGNAVSSAGDINGDGIDDLLVSAPSADPNGKSSGETYLVFGRSDGFAATLEVPMLNGVNGYRFQGKATSDLSGSSISGAGDINGDGVDDLLIGAPSADPNGTASGESYVVFGGIERLQALDRLSGEANGRIDLRKLGIVLGTDDRDTIAGTRAEDRIVGFKGADSLAGHKGDDILRGQRGNDLLEGGTGDDILLGGRGINTLYGGEGADVFVMRVRDEKRDVIRDFEDGRDLIDLRKLDIDFSDLEILDEGPGKVRINVDGDVIMVRDDGARVLSAADLGTTDFLF